MPLHVDALVRRAMRPVPAFVLAEHAVGEAPGKVALEDDEVVIGWYVNPPPREDVVVFFTTRAIVVAEGAEIKRFPFRDIASWTVQVPKSEVSGVVVCVGEVEHFIPFAGRRGVHGKFADAFDLASMLNVLVSLPRGALP